MREGSTPTRIGPLTLRNRFVKTATYEGLTPGGRVSEGLVAHHRQMASKGVALTTVAYGAVAPEGRTMADQLLVAHPAELAPLADAVHEEGGAISLQLAHCGGFSKNRAAGTPLAPTAGWNPYGIAYGLPRSRGMDRQDMKRVREAYVRAARVAVEAGFDALELHLGHGYLLSQFLSPLTNHRTDAYGGARDARMRFPVEVAEAVREAVPDTALLAKINLDDGVRGGATLDDGIALAMALVHDPEVLIIDELSLGLAPTVVQQLLGIIDELKAQGQTMIIVEQSLQVALAVADRAIFMEKGQVKFSGPTAELLERDDLARAVFLGGDDSEATRES